MRHTLWAKTDHGVLCSAYFLITVYLCMIGSFELFKVAVRVSELKKDIYPIYSQLFVLVCFFVAFGSSAKRLVYNKYSCLYSVIIQ